MRHTKLIILGTAVMSLAVASTALGLTADTDNFRTEVSYCVRSSPTGVSRVTLHGILGDVVDEWNEAAALTHDQALELTNVGYGDSCSADVPIVAAHIDGYGSYTGSSIELDESPQKAWSTTAEANRANIQEVLTHEMGHSFGLSHSGKATWYNKDGSNKPSMFTLIQTNSAEITSIEIDDWGGLAIVESLGNAADSFLANPGFESSNGYGWTKVGVTIGTCSQAQCTKSGDYRAKLDHSPDGHVIGRETYDPWKVVEDSTPVVQDGMTSTPTIGYSAWIKDGNTSSGSGYAKIYRNYRRFKYNGEKWKGSNNHDPTWVDLWAGWWQGDWTAPTQSWTKIGDETYLPLSKTDVGGVDYVEGVVFKVKILNEHNSKILVDQVELTGGFTQP